MPAGVILGFQDRFFLVVFSRANKRAHGLQIKHTSSLAAAGASVTSHRRAVTLKVDRRVYRRRTGLRASQVSEKGSAVCKSALASFTRDIHQSGEGWQPISSHSAPFDPPLLQLPDFKGEKKKSLMSAPPPAAQLPESVIETARWRRAQPPTSRGSISGGRGRGL